MYAVFFFMVHTTQFYRDYFISHEIRVPMNQSEEAKLVVFILNWVVATQIFFIFTPKLGEMIQFDEHIFQRGWFNHQLVQMGWFNHQLDKLDEF